MSIRPRKPLFERLKQGLEEGIAHARGEINLRTVVMPEEPPEIDAETLVSLRDQSAMSQAVFARLLNVSPKTVQSWEQGVRTPSHASRRLIQIFSEHPEAVCRSVGLPPVKLKGLTIQRISPGHRKIVIQDHPLARANRPKPAAKKPRSKSKTPR